MAHDFYRFPELTNAQMGLYYFESPHKQITENFMAWCVNVHDGDTIRVTCDFRNFAFPIRFLEINAPELKDRGGFDSRNFLRNMILHRQVYIKIDPHNRVDKWGRLLAWVIFEGNIMNNEMVVSGHATPFDKRNEGDIDSLDKLIHEVEQTWQV